MKGLLLVSLGVSVVGGKMLRCEWKCNALNAPSWNAAERFGFRYEGTFRQAWVQKDRNRDNAWFSIIDGEWPAIRSGIENWLNPANFDESDTQRQTLAHFMTLQG